MDKRSVFNKNLRVSFKNSLGYKLSGVISKPPRQNHRFIIMVHGFAGNKDEKGLFVDASNFFLEKGFSVFRFDISGCGESEGDLISSDLKTQKNDLICALNFLKEKETIHNNNLFLIGFSLGATISLLGHEDLSFIKGFAFWSPVLFPSRDMFPRYFQETIFNEIREKGYFTKSGVKVGESFLYDLAQCNLAPNLVNFRKPTIIIHGGNDQRIDPESSKIGKILMNGNTNFKLLDNACHSFRSPNSAKNELFSSTFIFFKNLLENDTNKESKVKTKLYEWS